MSGNMLDGHGLHPRQCLRRDHPVMAKNVLLQLVAIGFGQPDFSALIVINGAQIDRPAWSTSCCWPACCSAW